MKETTRWLRSFQYAYEGIQYALATQRNMKIHIFISFIVLLSALLIHLPKLEILFIILSITLVIVTELINTAVEKTVDLAMPERHPTAKIAKDLAAASVLVSAVFAIAVGAIVFFDPIDRWFHQSQLAEETISPGAVWIYLGLVFLTVIVLETRFSNSRNFRPSIWTAIAFSISTFITLISVNTLVSLLSFSLSFLFGVLLYAKRNRPLPVLLFGAAIGVAITGLAFYLS